MTDATPGSQDQTKQSDVHVETPFSQVRDEADTFEKSELKKELKAACTQLQAILDKRHSGNKQTYLRELWVDYRMATLIAKYHRTAVHAQGQILDLDTATADDTTQFQIITDHENQALDAYHTILKIMRADRIVFTEIEEASRKVLLLAHETPYFELFADMVQAILDGIERERENMASFLIKLSEFSD